MSAASSALAIKPELSLATDVSIEELVIIISSEKLLN
jgi:hypothetical protein